MHTPLQNDLIACAGGQRFATILADPPWQFQNRTGKMAPEHRRLARYGTLALPDIGSLPVRDIAADRAHLYLWVPNALLPEGLAVMAAWGFTYKSNIVWHKVRKDGGPDGRGVGFYFRNTTELILFGVRGKDVRTLSPGRRQVNILKTIKREHSRKPGDLFSRCLRADRDPAGPHGVIKPTPMRRRGTPTPITRPVTRRTTSLPRPRQVSTHYPHDGVGPKSAHSAPARGTAQISAPASSAASTSATGNPSSLRTILVPRTSATIL